jgi:formylmethanofuran dehydrogenase subunit E
MTRQSFEAAPDPVWCRDHRGREFTWAAAMDLIRGFHGHAAPGLAVGVKMVDLALSRMKPGALWDVICETGSCLPDAVQMLTPCTVGNGWLRIEDLGRFALVMYDKQTGRGGRVSIAAGRLADWPDFRDWFYKAKPKAEQDRDLILDQIREAGPDVLDLRPVRVKAGYLAKRSKGAIATCPACGEAYPASHGPRCRGCQGEAVCTGDPPAA